METLRRELSARLPEARLLEFTFDDPDPATPRIELPDDGRPMSGRDIVTTALALLRENYVFPEVADRAATAVEARLAAGEYDDLDEPALAELLTGHLNEICDDKHLRVRARGPRPGGPDGGGPGSGRPGPGGPGGPGAGPAGGARRSRGAGAGDAPDGAAGQLRHPPGRAPRRQHRLPRPAPGAGAGDRGPGHGRRDGAHRRDLRAHHRPASQRRRRAGRGGVLVQLPVRRSADAPQRHLPRRHRRDQAVLGAAVRARAPLPRPAGLRAEQRRDLLRGRGLRLHAAGARPGRGDRRDDRRRRPPHPDVPDQPRGAHRGAVRALGQPRHRRQLAGHGRLPDVAVPEAEARDVAYAKALRHVLDRGDVPPPIEDEARAALDGLPAGP